MLLLNVYIGRIKRYSDRTIIIRLRNKIRCRHARYYIIINGYAAVGDDGRDVTSSTAIAGARCSEAFFYDPIILRLLYTHVRPAEIGIRRSQYIMLLCFYTVEY